MNQLLRVRGGSYLSTTYYDKLKYQSIDKSIIFCSIIYYSSHSFEYSFEFEPDTCLSEIVRTDSLKFIRVKEVWLKLRILSGSSRAHAYNTPTESRTVCVCSVNKRNKKIGRPMEVQLGLIIASKVGLVCMCIYTYGRWEGEGRADAHTSPVQAGNRFTLSWQIMWPRH